MTNDNRNIAQKEKKVFNFEASKENEDIELSSISSFKAHGIIYICNKQKKSPKNLRFKFGFVHHSIDATSM